MKQAVIIAGGKGTRLGLTNIPKPMAEVCGKPLLQHQIELLKKYNFEEVFLLEGHLANVIQDYFKDGKNFDLKIHHIVEEKPLGTAGCLKLLQEKYSDILEERFLVFYGDIFLDFDIDSFINFDKEKKLSDNNSLGTAIVHPNDHPYDSDLLDYDKDYKIVDVLPKPHNENEIYKNCVNSAVYIFSKDIFSFIEKGYQQDIGKDILAKIIKSNKNIYAYKTSEYLKDMGTKERLKQVENDYFTGKVAKLNKKNKRPCIFLDRDGTININKDREISIENFKLINNVSEAIKKINKSLFLSIVITNQPLIAKGIITFEDVEQMHNKMETILGKEGAFLDDIYYCPHHPESGFEGEIKELKINCECRKPNVGLFLKAKNEFNIDMENSWMIGDHERDMMAGKKAGCRTIFIPTDGDMKQSLFSQEEVEKNENIDFYCSDLLEAVNLILNNQQDK